MNITQTVTKKLKLFTSKKVVTQLDGNYDSLFKGKGIELDSLREYVVGDSIKDIDWRATARTNKVQTRKYTALRDQQILLIADTSKSMLLEGYKGLNKRDALYGTAVVLGAFVKKNGDIMALCLNSSAGKIKHTKFSNTNNHIEHILQEMDSSLTSRGVAPANLSDIMTFALSSTKKRSAMFIVSDSFPDLEAIEAPLKKLSKKHQLFFVQMTPTSPFHGREDGDFDVVDIETNTKLDKSLSFNKKLQDEWQKLYNESLAKLHKRCRGLGISFAELSNEEETMTTLQNMFLEAKKYASRRR